MKKKTIIMYSIPAHGHINSTLYLMKRLKAEGYTVIYYSLEPFRTVVESCGCIFRSYPMDQNAIDLTDGKRLLKLYRLLLEYTARMLPQLLKEAKAEQPVGIIYDSLALWGRAVSEVLDLPGFSFYSIIAINGVFRKSFGCYASGFSLDFFRYLGQIPAALRWRKHLKQRYGIHNLGLISVLMNRGNYNLMGYSRQMQPGGRWFGRDYIFLGSLSRRRPPQEVNDSMAGVIAAHTKKTVIYISLGTVFNENKALYQALISQLGGLDVWVIMAARLEPELTGRLPENFIVEPFVNQTKILEYADLFISAGGMNSIHEALHQGVPCLLYPQQGEQYINARQFERLGFGLILKQPEQLGIMAAKAMRLNDHWSDALRSSLTKTRVTQALQIINEETAKVKN